MLVGLGVGFGAGYAVKTPREVEKIVYKEVKVPVITEVAVTAPPSEDLVFNVSLAAKEVYGKLVEVNYQGMRVAKIVVDPMVKNYEQYCPVARELENLSQKLPDRVVYLKKY